MKNLQEITTSPGGPPRQVEARVQAMVSHAYFCLDVDQRSILAAATMAQRDAFLLVTVWGYTTSETAELLGVDQSTVSRLCDTMRKKITEALHKKRAAPDL